MHGYLISIAAAWLIRRRWISNRPTNDQQISKYKFRFGIVAITAGIILHLVAELTVGISLDGAGMLLLPIGLLWCWGGRTGARNLSIAVLFLIFMVPLPFSWQQPIGELLQHFVSATSEAALGLCGLVVHREGYMLPLPGHILEVVQGCSGIRQITVFLGMVGGSKIHTATMLAFSIPIAVLDNTLRITMTGLITWHLGPEWAAGALHDIEGLIAVLFGLAMLWWLSKFISNLLSNGDPSAQKMVSSDSDLPETTTVVTGLSFASRLSRNDR